MYSAWQNRYRSLWMRSLLCTWGSFTAVFLLSSLTVRMLCLLICAILLTMTQREVRVRESEKKVKEREREREKETERREGAREGAHKWKWGSSINLAVIKSDLPRLVLAESFNLITPPPRESCTSECITSRNVMIHQCIDINRLTCFFWDDLIFTSLKRDSSIFGIVCKFLKNRRTMIV